MDSAARPILSGMEERRHLFSIMNVTSLIIDEYHNLLGEQRPAGVAPPAYLIPRSGRLVLKCSDDFHFTIWDEARALGIDGPNTVVLWTKNGQYQEEWTGSAVLQIDLDIPPPSYADSKRSFLGPHVEGDRLALMIGYVDRTPRNLTKGGIVVFWMGDLVVASSAPDQPGTPVRPTDVPPVDPTQSVPPARGVPARAPFGTTESRPAREGAGEVARSRTLRMTIHDGLGLRSGFVSPAPYQITSYFRVPGSWFDGETLLADREHRLFEERFARLYGGPNWRSGNADGSRFVVLDSRIDALDEAAIREKPWMAKQQGYEVNGCFHVRDDKLVMVKPEEF
jgi:hypothetical protein